MYKFGQCELDFRLDSLRMFLANPCHFPSDGLTGWIFGGKGGKEVAVENPNLQITRSESTLGPTDSTGDLSQEDVSLNLQLIQEKVNNVVSYKYLYSNIIIFIETVLATLRCWLQNKSCAFFIVVFSIMVLAAHDINECEMYPSIKIHHWSSNIYKMYFQYLQNKHFHVIFTCLFM